MLAGMTAWKAYVHRKHLACFRRTYRAVLYRAAYTASYIYNDVTTVYAYNNTIIACSPCMYMYMCHTNSYNILAILSAIISYVMKALLFFLSLIALGNKIIMMIH